jgi:N-acyl-D-amino-acid deacylase
MKVTVPIAALLAGVVLVLTACAPDAPESTGVVIVNARVIDGSGGPSRDVNVRVVGDRIADVGNFEPSAEDTLVDANGLVLAPGFIDAHSHHEDGLFEMPGALAAVSQGITTIVAGQDGGQQYPLAEFFASLETSPAAINVASYAGHGTLRDQVMGEDYHRQATPEELAEMAGLLRIEMEAGALGLTTGLEYDPGSFSATEELVELAREAALHGGRYVSHIRSEDQYFWEAIDEIITIGREAPIPVHVSHIKLAMTRWWGQADRLTTKLDEARASGVDITADIYPYRAWNSGFSWLTTLFPDRDLDRRDGAKYILSDMLSPEGILVAIYRPEPAYDGMTIAEIAELRGSDPETTLMELLKADMAMGGEESGSQMLGFAMDEPDIESIMAWPHTVIGSDGDLAGAHPRGFGAFTRFLGHYIRERNVISLEEGIRRMTSLSAQHVGIAERGSIQVGRYADLVLFDPERVRDRATPEAPHVPSTGIEKVWVNGQLVFEGGQITGNRPGKPIRRASP